MGGGFGGGGTGAAQVLSDRCNRLMVDEIGMSRRVAVSQCDIVFDILVMS